MSYSPTNLDPTSPVQTGQDILLRSSRAETAPSQEMQEGPAFTRLLGMIGLFGLMLGIALIITNEFSARWIGKSGGYLFATVGIMLMLYHAIRDHEVEVRRTYGLVAAIWFILGVAICIVPGPVFTSGASKEVGFNLLSGLTCLLISLLFAIPFARNESDPTYRNLAVYGLLGIGTLLTVGGFGAAAYKPDTLIGPGIVFLMLGVAYICAFFVQVDTSEGFGYSIAFGLGILGGALLTFSIVRSAVPTLLYDGPNILRTPTGDFDKWKVAGRALVIFLFLGVLASGILAKQIPLWLRSTLGAIGILGVAILLLASFRGNLVSVAPQQFLVPTGLILATIGTIYMCISLGICSDVQFITLTRRELSAYFLSRLGYMVLGGMVLTQWYAYLEFYGIVSENRNIAEPIVKYYFFGLLPVMVVIFQIPALTMRLVAEERRTGSLEVLLTAAVNETPIILSKFLATWIFYIICWLPSAIFLIAFRIETDTAFDYRPLLSFYAALIIQGAAFISIGLFFSTITRDQVVAAVLSFVAMIFFLVCYFIKESQSTYAGLPSFIQTAIGKLSYIHTWKEALSGQLLLRDLLLFFSIAIFFNFLSIKTLEARKWN